MSAAAALEKCLLVGLALVATAGFARARGADVALETDRIKVVATLPDLAELARFIGGDRVEVKALARPGQNLHAVRVKPSHLVALHRADLFIQMGLSLEHAWVPGLLRTARNREVLPGMRGFVSAGDGYPMIEVPVRLDRSLSADVHPQGNPHINLSLNGGLHMAERIRDGLIKVDPDHAKEYELRFEGWKGKYDKARLQWEAIAVEVRKKGASACLYHQEFDYLLGELGLEIAAFFEPRPGLAPTPSHLAKVVTAVRDRSIPVLLTAPWSNNKNLSKVSRSTGSPVLELPVMVGGQPEHGTWIEMMDDCVNKLAHAYGVDPDDVRRRAAAEVPDGTVAGR